MAVARSIQGAGGARRMNAGWVHRRTHNSMGVVGRIRCCASWVGVAVSWCGIARVRMACEVTRVGVRRSAKAVMMVGLCEGSGWLIVPDNAAVSKSIYGRVQISWGVPSVLDKNSLAYDRVRTRKVHQGVFFDVIDNIRINLGACSISRDCQLDVRDSTANRVLIGIGTAKLISLFQRVVFVSKLRARRIRGRVSYWSGIRAEQVRVLCNGEAVVEGLRNSASIFHNCIIQGVCVVGLLTWNIDAHQGSFATSLGKLDLVKDGEIVDLCFRVADCINCVCMHGWHVGDPYRRELLVGRVPVSFVDCGCCGDAFDRLSQCPGIGSYVVHIGIIMVVGSRVVVCLNSSGEKRDCKALHFAVRN